MTEKINVAIVFGGRSTEHEISLLSAKNVINSLDREKYNPVLIGIDKKGKWFYNEASVSLLGSDSASTVQLENQNVPVILSQNSDSKALISASTSKTLATIDVLYPVLHGTSGEDGSIQGLAKLANIPCVGCGILGSAVGMDKDIMKRILRDSKIPVADFVTVRNTNYQDFPYEEVSEKLGKDLFLKPANLGSSVGVSFVHNKEEYDAGIQNALLYDHKLIVEETILGRELECAVLGNEYPMASIPGEVVPKGGFYSYENKYLDEKGAELIIPASLSEEKIKEIQELSIRTFQLIECEGMTRVDMFMQEDGRLVINEVNTIPGFTSISMYPKLWAHSGVNNTDLVTKLIEYAILSHEKRNKLKIE
jgi:D-alanine-D-alanine ligase